MNENKSENQPIVFAKIRKITLPIILITGVFLIPLLILSFLDIGGIVVYIFTIVVLGLLILESLVLIIADIIRIIKIKKEKQQKE